MEFRSSMTTRMKLTSYLSNCFLLLVPIFLWNIFLVDSLPPKYSPALFDKGIPSFVSISENVLRGVVFVLPVLMKFELISKRQKVGFALYVIGTLIYFSSWLMLILAPDSSWSESIYGFMAPAYTTLFWLFGIGLIGSKSFLKLRSISIVYLVSAVAFVIVHTTHARLAFWNE